jgi:hypothetical protein
MMDQQVVLRVRPGETVRFPAQCVACGQPAGERISLRKRRGQVTRRVEAPLCAGCARQLARRSGQEERFLRLRWPVGLITAALLAVLALVVLPLDSRPLELILAVTIGLVAGIIVWYALVRRAAQAELPERRAVAEAAQIVDFTWRDMTLSFVRADVAERVRELNADMVGGIPGAGEAPGGEPETNDGAPLVGEPSP